MDDKPTETALVPYAGGTAVANLPDLAEKARDYAERSLAPGTRRLYDLWWGKFTAWCDANGMAPLPAGPGTLAAFFTWLAEGQPGLKRRGRFGEGHVLSNTAMASVWSAINHFHERAGYPLSKMQREAAQSLDDRERRQWAALQQIRDGIRRTIGQSRSVRRVKGISDLELRDMLDLCRPDVLADARDAAILAIGFGGCRRRSEVVGIDYLKRGDGTGYLSVDDKVITITLQSSKTNQAGKAEVYPLYRKHVRVLCDWVDNWIKVSQPAPGQALFRRLRATGRSQRPQSGYKGVHWHETAAGKGSWVAQPKIGGKLKHLGYFDDARAAHLAVCKETGETPHEPFAAQRFLGDRLSGASVAEIVKHRYAALLRKRYGKKLREDQIQAMAEAKAQVSGHSLRRGHITTAAQNGVAVHDIQKQSGHATAAMVTDTYISVELNEKSSSQKGMRLG